MEPPSGHPSAGSGDRLAPPVTRQPKRRRGTWAAASAVLLAVALVGAGCGNDNGNGNSAGTTASTQKEANAGSSTTAGGQSSSSAQGMGTSAVEVTDSSLGRILTSNGMTLYLFTPDNGGASTCYNECAKEWPPLRVDGNVSVGQGLDGSKFSTVPRNDGGHQVTVNGWPLYFYENDKAPGDVKGQGVDGIWYVVSPNGEAIKTGG